MNTECGYQICSRCVMDNLSDLYIKFDEYGRCNYCTKALDDLKSNYFPTSEGEGMLKSLVEQLKNDGKGKKYDCLMGISGGLDSVYLAYLGSVKWGLRILAVHIEDGFDVELAKQNISNLCKACNLELINVKPDSIEFANITKAFIRAEVPNVAIPQDNILHAILYKYARDYKIKYFLSGFNLSLESILQKGNSYMAYDLFHIKKIHKLFGDGSIKKLPFISQYRRDWDRMILGINTLYPLNLIEYNKSKAIKELSEFCNFQYYEAKHLENDLTKIIQLKWFVEKFKVEKRKSHLSSLIISGQISREEAIAELAKPLYNVEQMEKEVDIVLGKLGMSKKEFYTYLQKPGVQHTDYPTDKYIYPLYCMILGGLSKIKKILVNYNKAL